MDGHLRVATATGMCPHPHEQGQSLTGPGLWACPAQTAAGLLAGTGKRARSAPSRAPPAEASMFSPGKWGGGAASEFLCERSCKSTRKKTRNLLTVKGKLKLQGSNTVSPGGKTHELPLNWKCGDRDSRASESMHGGRICV